LLDTIERTGFDDIVLETTGVGQINYEAQLLVDTLVLVLNPESGDSVQAMKAGILEMADLYVVNKADLPGAERTAVELRAVVERRSNKPSAQPRVILTSAKDCRGIVELSAALDVHYSASDLPNERAVKRLKRSQYQLRTLVAQRLDEVIAEGCLDYSCTQLSSMYNDILRKMHVPEQ
jgi:LAO/AO transport system kinase